MTTLLLRQEGGTASKTLLGLQDDQEELTEEGLFCLVCGQFITSHKHALEVDGSHCHTFFNPLGVIFEIGCFSRADGCQEFGDTSTEFTWFAGYSWRPSLCTACTAHLGWLFNSSDSAFYGLIMKNLSSGG